MTSSGEQAETSVPESLSVQQLASVEVSPVTLVMDRAPLLDVQVPELPGTWYVGIDIATASISAVLLDSQTGKLYPIRWSQADADEAEGLALEPSPEPWDEAALGIPGDSASETGFGLQQNSLGSELLPTPTHLFRGFKQYLNLAMPYQSLATQDSQPQVQWSDQHQISLDQIRQMLVGLLQMLRSPQPQGSRSVVVEGMTASTLQSVLNQLVGVVLGYPNGWSDAYCFNLREAILEAGLVNGPEQIFFMEEAIAALLTELPQSGSDAVRIVSSELPDRLGNAQASWQGATLVLHTGATNSELLLVNLLRESTQLSFEQLHLRTVLYGENAFEEDILCQFLYPCVAPAWRRLNLPALESPLPGEPDMQARYRLQRCLHSSDLGLGLLQSARQIKLTLQEQVAVSFGSEDQPKIFYQDDVHNRIVPTYIQRLNRELNTLLSQTGIVVEAFQQVLCAGELASSWVVAQWLKQKLPNATLVPVADAGQPYSRIACGLAMLPLYPQVLNTLRHQYSTLFLLREMLKTLPTQPLSLGRILQLLENRGINTAVCQRAILNLLEGQLPTGLFPAAADAGLLSQATQCNPDYQVLTSRSLFSKQENQYSLDGEMGDRLLQYFEAMLVNTQQTLEDPLPFCIPQPTSWLYERRVL